LSSGAAQREKWSRFGDPQAERSIDEAKRAIEQELKWSEEKLDELRKKAARRAAPELKDDGEGEGKLAERTRDLAKKGRDQEELPGPALDALHDAAEAEREASRALRDGDAERGLTKQREAQQKLEQAKEALGDQDGEGRPGGREGDEGPLSQDHADIPKAEQHRGPEEFRRRVMKGLAQPSGGRLKDSVKRYAEGLLR
jgi:hypothetical protein